MPQWDPKQYLQFAQQRTQPCIDLVARIPREKIDYAIDLGCGPGNSTQVLGERFPAATIIGVDHSHSMIQRAQSDHPRFQFHQGNIIDWTSPRPCDVILSNAALQWIDQHEILLPRLISQLARGGVLAIQMPRNFQSPVHQILRELARSASFAEKLSPRQTYWVQSPEFYYDVLAPLSQSVELWQTEYIHILPDQEAIIEWYKGTGLRPYLEALDPQEQEEFIAQLRSRLIEAYPRQRDGRVVFPFLRLFLMVVR